MSEKAKDTLKKIGLFTLIAFCMGDTIGAGIFSTLPTAVSMVGPGIMWAWIAAIAMIIFVTIPTVIPSSSLPCPSSTYMIPSKLINPYFGFFEILSMMNYALILGLLSIFFAQYCSILWPGAPTIPIAIGAIILFWIINLFGIEAGTKVQNVIVIILVCTLVAFCITGAPHVDHTTFSIGNFIKPSGLTATAFFACMAMCYTCLGGSFTGALVLGDRIKNPRRNIFLGGCLTAVIVGCLFATISLVVCGICDYNEELPALGDIAKIFMPTGLWYIFMIGGALCAMLSTMNAMICSVGYRFGTMADDGIFPKCMAAENKRGVKYISVSITPVFGILCAVLNPPIDSLISACAMLAVAGAIIRIWPLVNLPKRYPHTYKRAVLVLSTPVIWIWCIAATALCVIVSISSIITTPGKIWVVIGITLAVLYAYFLIRIKYMKSKGVDVYANMGGSYAPWDEAEEKYRQEDEALN